MPNHRVVLHYLTGLGGLAGLVWLLRDGGHFLRNENGSGPSKPETFNRVAVPPNPVLTEMPSAETPPEPQDSSGNTSTPDLDYFLRTELPRYTQGERTCATHVSRLRPRQAKMGVQCGTKLPLTNQLISPNERIRSSEFAAMVRGALHTTMSDLGFRFINSEGSENRLYERP